MLSCKVRSRLDVQLRQARAQLYALDSARDYGVGAGPGAHERYAAARRSLLEGVPCKVASTMTLS